MTGQPIETAPFNKPILVNNTHAKYRTPVVAEKWKFDDGKIDYGLYGSCGCNDIPIKPTHWMLLDEIDSGRTIGIPMKSHDICNAVVFACLSGLTALIYSNTHDLDALWTLVIMFFFVSKEKSCE